MKLRNKIIFFIFFNIFFTWANENFNFEKLKKHDDF